MLTDTWKQDYISVKQSVVIWHIILFSCIHIHFHTVGTDGTVGTVSTVGTVGTVVTVGTVGTFGKFDTVGTVGTATATYFKCISFLVLVLNTSMPASVHFNASYAASLGAPRVLNTFKDTVSQKLLHRGYQLELKPSRQWRVKLLLQTLPVSLS